MGSRLEELRKRSGLSMRALARDMGYSNASSIQRYLADDYDPRRMPIDLAERFADALQGKGQPPIHRSEIVDMAGIPAPEAMPFRMEGASLEQLPHNVPVFGTALGAPEVFDGEAIEQTMLDESNVITYFARPAFLARRLKVYGIFIQGSSMSPRFEEGETAYVDPEIPPRVNDDVVLKLAVPDFHDGDRVGAVLIKRLKRRTADYVELEQFNPRLTFRVDRERVKAIHRVIPWAELLS